MQPPTLYGPKNAELTIVSWGSNKGVILEAMKSLNQENKKSPDQKKPLVNYIHTSWMSPFPSQSLKEQLGKAKRLLNIECNYTAQFAGLVRQYTGVEIRDHLLKYDGRPFYVEEIVEKVKNLINIKP